MDILRVRNNIINILFCLTFAIAIVIVLSIGIYAIDLRCFSGEFSSDISNSGLSKEYIHMINYLINPLVKNLKFYYFDASAAGLEHFADVKQLFLVNNIIFIVSFALKKFLKIKLVFYKTEALVSMMVPIILGMLAALDFDDFFVMFHKLLFTNSNWLFDPVTDPIINVLPEVFFEQLIIIAILIFEILIVKGYITKKLQQH